MANKAAEKEVTDLWSFCPECGPNVKVDEDGCCASCGNGAVGPEVIKLGAEFHRLHSLATRWYLADGTFETLPEEEVTRRRKEAAKVLERGRDVDAIYNIVDNELANLGWQEIDQDGCDQIARALAAYLSGKEVKRDP